jgi:hypothetical protein
MLGRIAKFVHVSTNRRSGARNCRTLFAPMRGSIVAAAVLSVLLVAQPARSQSAAAVDDAVSAELAAMGKRGQVIAVARQQTLAILQSENACSEWFRETDPDSAEVFRSLHYEITEHEPAFIFHMKDGQGGGPFKHPWAARSTQNAGQNSTVGLNSGGPFFNVSSPVLEVDSKTAMQWPAGLHRLVIASFLGNSPGARIVTLLHELGHIVGRIPEDSDSWDGLSSRNTEEVLRHCKHDIRDAASESTYRSSR